MRFMSAGQRTAAGYSQPSCSISSYPRVFSPSRRKGCFSDEKLAAVWVWVNSLSFLTHVFYGTVYQGDVGAVQHGLQVVGLRDILWHEDVSLESGGRGVGGEGCSGVACAGDGDVLEAVVLRHADGERDAASGAAAGGVCALVLEVEAGVALAEEERRAALAEGDERDVGQDAGVAPDAE